MALLALLVCGFKDTLSYVIIAALTKHRVDIRMYCMRVTCDLVAQRRGAWIVEGLEAHTTGLLE